MTSLSKRASAVKPASPPRGRPRLADAERKRILDATTAVFLEKGFKRASTNEIARRARTSKQTLYALFPAKADLFVGVVSAHTEQLFSHHAYYIESEKPPRQALTEIGERTLSMFSSPTFLALYRIVVAETPHFPELGRQLWTVCMERGCTLLAEYLKSRRIGGREPRRAAAQFVSMVLGDFLMSAMLRPDMPLSRPALKARVKEAVKSFLVLHPASALRKTR
jgi:AcrR family transcriptional regulator